MKLLVGGGYSTANAHMGARASGVNRVRPIPGRPWYGMLSPDDAHLAGDFQAGARLVEIGVTWDAWEPRPGEVNAAYRAVVRLRLERAREAGLAVVLDPGLQYAPAWVFNGDRSARFTDQFGDRDQGGPGENAPDGVWDMAVRRAEGTYLTMLAESLQDVSFFAVRAGGLDDGELRYPTPPAGHPDAYWSFSQAARASSPIPNYRPGSSDTAAGRIFLDWYMTSLRKFQNWLVSKLQAEFHTTVMVLYPGWGIRPGEVEEAIAGHLSGRSTGERRKSINMGLDWAHQLESIPSGAMPYTTWLDAPDQGTNQSLESPVRYLTELASARHLSVAGENTGHNTAAALAQCVRRVRLLGLQGMLWMSDADLWGQSSYATIGDFTREVKGEQG